MSAVLIVTKDKRQIAKVALGPGVFVIGRSEKCNLHLDEPLASRRHAEIFMRGQRYSIRDLDTRNGTLLGGQKLTHPRDLHDGDEIEIGSMRLKFLCEDAEAGDGEETRAAPQGELGKKSPGQAVVEKKEKGNLDVRLRVADGPLAGGVFKNWEGPLHIGRSKENHVMLVDNAVSLCHARIVQEGERFFIVDTDSANGTFLNGVKVAQRAELADGNKIKMGASTLIFDLTDRREQRRKLNIALICFIVFAVIVLAIKLWPDPAGDHIQTAQHLEDGGDFARASAEFKVAMNLAPNRSAARAGYARVNAKIEAIKDFETAKVEAAAEHYDKALEWIYMGQHIFPNNESANELKKIIDAIKGAQLAVTHEEWEVAIKSLLKAQDVYPNHTLIKQELEHAQNEWAAKQHLSEAEQALQHGQWLKASNLLSTISSTSVYASRAKQDLDEIDRQEKTLTLLNKARSLYNQGQLEQALDEIDSGLKVSSNNPSMLDLQKHVRAMRPLADPLKRAESLTQQDAIDDLLAGRKACANVLQVENDPLNVMVSKATDVDARISHWLQTLSQSFTDKAQDLLKSGTPGNRRAALEQFLRASKADPSNRIAEQQGKELRSKIILECGLLYKDAERFLELSNSDEAKPRLKAILELDLPDDQWYLKAKEMLDRLK